MKKLLMKIYGYDNFEDLKEEWIANLFMTTFIIAVIYIAFSFFFNKPSDKWKEHDKEFIKYMYSDEYEEDRKERREYIKKMQREQEERREKE